MPTGWKALGDAIKRERFLLGMDQVRFSDHVGLRPRIISALETGERESYSPETLIALEVSLGWKAGSVERIREGREPILEDDPLMVRFRPLWFRMTDQQRQALLSLARAFMGR